MSRYLTILFLVCLFVLPNGVHAISPNFQTKRTDSLIREKTINKDMTQLELLILYQNALKENTKDSIEVFRQLAILNADLAQPKDALIYTEKNVVTIFTGLKELKELFKADLFVQIHRSYLLNAQKDITADFNTNHIHVNKTYMVPISRRLKKGVLDWFKRNNMSIPLQS